MAGFFQQLTGESPGSFLGGIAKGFFGNDYLRDFQHASKTFRTNGYAYSPKFKFLFHVYFKINKQYIDPLKAAFPEDSHFGLLVKKVQLPGFTFDIHTMNQYNRKRIVQTKIKYDDIQISFHDDNANLVRQLWYNYYTYHYKDATKFNNTTSMKKPTSTANSPQKFDFKKNTYDAVIDENDWGYMGEKVLDQPSSSLMPGKAPFFDSINIYGFNQHNFVMYQLINPIITSFKHDTYDYSSSNGTMENTMTLAYETVKYYDGAIDGQAITNASSSANAVADDFGTATKYDTRLSPISRPGSNATILGQGGLVSAGGGILQDLQSGNYGAAIQKAGMTFNTFKNQSLASVVKGDLMSIVSSSTTVNSGRNNSFNFNIPDLTKKSFNTTNNTPVNNQTSGYF